MNRRNSGFTALELATTIAIVAVIAALAMPPYLQWNRARRLEGAVVNLTADLEMAKIRAIRENAFVVVTFGTNSYSMFIDTGDGVGGPPNWNQDSGEQQILNREMPAGVQIDTGSLSFPLNNDKMRFNGRGIPPDLISPEIIPVANTVKNRQVSINRLGYINVQ
ncbi:MAG: GspH/FimT family protein [Desulfobacterales bacterium]|jgi:prepilin-type N-terminal cleavage/methylation domain-containing protein